MYVEKVVQHPKYIKELSTREPGVDLCPFQELKYVGGPDELQDRAKHLEVGPLSASGEEGPVTSRRNTTERIFGPCLGSNRCSRRLRLRQRRSTQQRSEQVLFNRRRRLCIVLLRR
jgi:hypothetical protein